MGLVDSFGLPSRASQPRKSWIAYFSSLFNPGDALNFYCGHALFDEGFKNVQGEPGFLSYQGGSDSDGDGTLDVCTPDDIFDCAPVDLHLAFGSPLKDKGGGYSVPVADPDGSKVDIGAFGGPLADDWDLDLDEWPAYYWPGLCADVPANVDAKQYDRDDFDTEVGACQ